MGQENREAPVGVNEIVHNVRFIDTSSRDAINNALEWLQYAKDTGAFDKADVNQLAELRAAADNVITSGQRMMEGNVPHSAASVEANSRHADLQSIVETSVGMANELQDKLEAARSRESQGATAGRAEQPEVAMTPEQSEQLDWARSMIQEVLDELDAGNDNYFAQKFGNDTDGRGTLKERLLLIAKSGETEGHRQLKVLVDEADRQILIREVKGDIAQQPAMGQPAAEQQPAPVQQQYEQPQGQVPTAQTQQPKKKGFFKRLFG